jgi:hypothetical protein
MHKGGLFHFNFPQDTGMVQTLAQGGIRRRIRRLPRPHSSHRRGRRRNGDAGTSRGAGIVGRRGHGGARHGRPCWISFASPAPGDPGPWTSKRGWGCLGPTQSKMASTVASSTPQPPQSQPQQVGIGTLK